MKNKRFFAVFVTAALFLSCCSCSGAGESVTSTAADTPAASIMEVQPETSAPETKAETTTVTTTTLMTTSAATTSGSLPETTAAVYSEDAEPKKSWLPAAALGLIAAGCGGLLGLIRLIRKQDSESD